MKIVIFGLTISSSWGNGHATLWRGLCRALARRGHQVVFFERDVPYYAAHRDLSELSCGKLILYSSARELAPRAREQLADADAAVVTSFCPDALFAADCIWASNARLRVFYDLDTPVTLSRLRSGRPVDYIGPRGLTDYDLVLSYTGGVALEALQTDLGARRVAPLYGSVDPEVHRPVPPVEMFRCDLSYLGTYAPDRQPALEALFIEPARQLPGQKFLLGGAQYPQEFPWTENIFFARHVAPPDHAAFYGSSRLTLNVTRAAMAEMGYCPSGRLFEAAACGTAILSDRWAGLEHFFTPASEILVASSTAEAIEILRLPQAEVTRVAAAARERVLAEHTADHRAAELEAALERALSPGATREFALVAEEQQQA